MEGMRMGARILDGRLIGQAVTADLRELARAERDRRGRPAGLAIVRVEGDAASRLYTDSLVRTCKRIGLETRVWHCRARLMIASCAASSKHSIVMWMCRASSRSSRCRLTSRS